MSKVRPARAHRSHEGHVAAVARVVAKPLAERAEAAEKDAEQKQATIGRLIELIRSANDQRDGALASHQTVVQFLMRAAAEDAALHQALTLARSKLPKKVDEDVLAVIDGALSGTMGAMFHGQFARAQAFGAVAGETAEALRMAEHELTVLHGLVAGVPSQVESMSVDTSKALVTAHNALAKYDALVNPPKAEEASDEAQAAIDATMAPENTMETPIVAEATP